MFWWLFIAFRSPLPIGIPIKDKEGSLFSIEMLKEHLYGLQEAINIFRKYCIIRFHNYLWIDFLTWLLLPSLNLPLGLFEGWGFFMFSEKELVCPHIIFFNHLSTIFIHINKSSSTSCNKRCYCCFVISLLKYY